MPPVRKAIITAAGRGTRMQPATYTVQKEMLPLVDIDGLPKPALQCIVESAVRAGIEEVAIVVSPGSRGPIESHFARCAEAGACHNVTMVEQSVPDGFGHAVWCARAFAGDDPVVILLGDHIFASTTAVDCISQALAVHARHGCHVSSVLPTHESRLYLFGALGGMPVGDREWSVTRIMEKPTIQVAREALATPGVPAHHYLCFFGVHVMNSSLFDRLSRAVHDDLRERGEIQLTSAQEALRAAGEPYVAYEADGVRCDLGNAEGYLMAQFELALRGPYRDQILAQLGHPTINNQRREGQP